MDESAAADAVADRLRELSEHQLVEVVARDLRSNDEYESMAVREEGPIDALGRVASDHSSIYGPYAVLVHHREEPLSVDRLEEFLAAVDREDCVLALVVADSVTEAARSLVDGYADDADVAFSPDHDGTLHADPMVMDLQDRAADMVRDGAYVTPTGVTVENGDYEVDEAFWSEVEAIEE